MRDKIQQIREKALAEIDKADGLEKLNDVRAAILGKKGELTAVLKGMKYGSSIPGIKPGRPTAEALDRILSRVTLLGALSLGVVALIPSFSSTATGITSLQGLGATSLIIMVGVALDFINQVKTQLLSKNYESFLKERP